MAKSADAFRTISEVAGWLDTPAHVLRFWESKFSQVKPVKRAGGRRYYRPADMKLLGGIKKLLHEDGLTIKGVQKMLREQGVKHVSGLSKPLDEVTEAEVSEIAIDVIPDEDMTPSTADVVSLRPDKPKPTPTPPPTATPVPESELSSDDGRDAASADHDNDPIGTDTTNVQTADIEEQSTGATDDTTLGQSQIEDEQAEDEQAEDTASADADAPESPQQDAPAMPSFLSREPEPSAVEDTPDEQPDEPASAPVVIPVTDIPDDPDDDIAADSGPLSALAQLSAPVSAEALRHFNKLADQLGSTDIASKS